MKLRKIFAGIVAGCVATTMAVSASAYTATLGFADGTWSAQDWASTVEINGDGTYSITSNCLFEVIDEETGDETTEAAPGTGAVVFVIDIAQLGADLGLNVAPEDATDDSWMYDTGDVKVTDIKLVSGDTEFEVDMSKVKIGDIETKGNLRIEIYNEYGPTKEAPAIDKDSFCFLAADQFTISFTIEGLDSLAGGDAKPETEAPETEAPETDAAPETQAPVTGDSSKPNTNTGVEGIALVAGVAVLAAGAVVVSKKRK